MGYLFVIVCQVIVGSSYPIAKAAIDTIPAWILACVTLAIASIILLPIASIVEKTKWTKFGLVNWYKVGVQSLCACVLYTVFLFFALSHASATVAGIFNGLSPALVFILAPFLVKERKIEHEKGICDYNRYRGSNYHLGRFFLILYRRNQYNRSCISLIICHQ